MEVHEPPLLGLEGTDQLIEGDVIAIEPGLCDAQLGEIRFEDLVPLDRERLRNTDALPIRPAAAFVAVGANRGGIEWLTRSTSSRARRSSG